MYKCTSSNIYVHVILTLCALTLIATLADGTHILPATINEVTVRVHVGLASVAPDGASYTMVHHMQAVLRSEGGRERDGGSKEGREEWREKGGGGEGMKGRMNGEKEGGGEEGERKNEHDIRDKQL